LGRWNKNNNYGKINGFTYDSESLSWGFHCRAQTLLRERWEVELADDLQKTVKIKGFSRRMVNASLFRRNIAHFMRFITISNHDWRLYFLDMYVTVLIASGARS